MRRYFDEDIPTPPRGENSGRGSVSVGKIPYRALTYYIGREVRVFARGNPLLSHPAIYEGRLAGVFEDPSAIILEDAYLLVLDRVPMQNHYHIVKRDFIGAIFIRVDEVRHLEILPEKRDE